MSSEVNQSPRNVRATNPSLEGRLYLRDEELDAGVALILAAQKRLLMAARLEIEASGMARRDCDVLIAIQSEPGLTVSQMCARLGMTVPTFARILGQLDKNGLIEKNRSARDGRARLLFLSQRGQEKIEPIFQAMRELLRDAYRRNGPEQVQGTRAVIAALLEGGG